MAVDPARLAEGIHFVRFSTQSQSGSLKSFGFALDLFRSKVCRGNGEGTDKGAAPAKLEAAYVDTVRVSKANYITAFVPISAYQLNMGVIILQVLDTCAPAMSPSGDGHAAGTNCMAAGCHVAGNVGPGSPNPAAPVVTACGTVYSSVTGGTPVSGATVRLIDSVGEIATLVTSPTGVFWIGSNCGGYSYGDCVPNDTTTKWVSASVSKCPNFLKMNGTAAGNCGSCHTSSKQIHLP